MTLCSCHGVGCVTSEHLRGDARKEIEIAAAQCIEESGISWVSERSMHEADKFSVGSVLDGE